MTGSNQMRVLIVGAGVAGLSCAVALRRAGAVDLTIVERASEVAAQGGTGIAIPPNGARALAAIGLPVDRLISCGSRLREYRFLDNAGRRLSVADLTLLWLSEAEPYFAVHRRRIYEVLLEALGEQKIDFQTAITLDPVAMTTGSSVRVKIDGPDRSRDERFDLVIGADGIRSTIRQHIWPSVIPRALGWWTWRCVLHYEGVSPDAQVVYSGRGGIFLHIPIGGGQVYVYAAIRRTDVDGAQRPESGHGRAIAGRFGGVGAPRSLFDAIEELPDRAFHVGPLEEVPHEELAGAGRGCAVLVGDALHACSPNMAQGVSLAAEDALVLADVMQAAGAGSGAASGAIADRFWQRRLPRIRHVQTHTRKRDHLINRRVESAVFEQISNWLIRVRGADRIQRDAFSYLLENRA
jgi:2-polyprenyl-6-methoxyphenol hydroxylase-like FAD-dependent oxidoreductase